MRSPIQTRFEDLPQELPVFPLSGALLLPWGRLPLNIFEPRYLNMTLDALAAGRMFGMIQPDYDAMRPEERAAADGAEQESNVVTLSREPVLYSVGCVGRISSFEETEDGRLLIVLKGLARFRVAGELPGRKGYRRVRADYTGFESDMDALPKIEARREAILERLKPYLNAKGMKMNVEAVQGLSDTALVLSLSMMCPFHPREKQALLEAADMKARAEMLVKLLEMGVFDAAKPDGPPQ